MPYFVCILSGVGDKLLPGCPQAFFMLKVRFRSNSESHKNPIQREESSYK